MSWKTFFCSAGLSAAIFFAAAAGAIALTGNINSHDPAGLIKDGGTYYHFTTGAGVWYSTSTNLTQWTPGPATVFPSGQWPAWINTAVPGFAGQFWAPDAIYMNGYYYLYYSASTFGSSRSAIGVTRTASLANPSWQDQGVVVQSDGSSNVINAIDPALFTDTNGNVYLSYGSWFGGIAVVQINQSTGKIVNGATPTKIAGGSGADWEAPYIVKEGSYYYLFVNRGNCCQGVNSTYRIVVGRATSVTGPYLNQSGGNLNSTDGTTVLATSGKYIGPGHFGLLREGSCNYVSTHYYDGNDNGNAKLDLLSLTFSNSWPTLTRDFTVGACATGNSLNVSTSSVSLASGAGSSPVTVTANVSWSATDNQSWLTVAPSTGSGNGNITISATANTGAARSGTVTVSGGSISRSIAVSQASGTSSSLTVSPSSLAFGSGGSSSTATLTSNVSWSVTDNQSWLTVSPTSGSNNGSLSVTAAANTGAARTGIVTVTGGSISQTINVSQSAAGGSGPIANGTYRLTNKNSNLSWDSWGCSGNAGETVAQGAYNNYNCQKWDISSASGGAYRIKSHITDNSAETTGCAAYTGALLQLGAYSGVACEQFTFTPTGDGDGSYYIALASGGKRVGVPQFSGSGQQLQLQDSASYLWQKWFIVAVAP